MRDFEIVKVETVEKESKDMGKYQVLSSAYLIFKPNGVYRIRPRVMRGCHNLCWIFRMIDSFSLQVAIVVWPR